MLDGLLLFDKMAKNAVHDIEEILKKSDENDKLWESDLRCHSIEMTGKGGFAQIFPKRQSLQRFWEIGYVVV